MTTMASQRRQWAKIEPKTVLGYKYPDDAYKIAWLSLDRKMEWYYAQDARTMIYLSNTAHFNTFWFRFYILPLRVKRFVYRFKFW